MALTPGSRIGPYEVRTSLGAGGMGEVYRAHDSKLNRDVALKILPETFARDVDRVARFKREAQVLASLNHPNIAAIYGFEDSGSIHALVLELVEGPTLAELLAGSGRSALGRNPDAAFVERSGQRPRPSAQGQEGTRGLSIDEALPIARQIAEAIEAAHEHGVIHRDLKPSNVKITPDGIVKVLDFGLAKALGPAEAGHDVRGGVGNDRGVADDRGVRLQPDLSQSPTMTSPALMTGVGAILGTAAYMAPEQAKGRPADKRADVWAFGCVLYEMLTGRAPFAGDDVSDTLANVLKREPDWGALPADTPPAIRALLRRCLEKDRRRRISDTAAALFAIDETAYLGAVSAPVAAIVTPSLMKRAAVPLSALVLGAALAATAISVRPVAPVDTPEMRLQVDAPPPGVEVGIDFAISPDGRNIVFRAPVDQTPQLWVRPLESEAARPLVGTEGALYPFWSPDNRSVGFFADQKLKRVDVAGGSVQTLADAPFAYGATWGTSGVIVFSGTNTAPLFRIPAAGGEKPVEVTRLTGGQAAHRFPHFLPDGRRFLFFVTGTLEVQGVFVGTLDSKEATRVLDADTAAVFVPPDWVLFGREESLYAQRLDLEALTPVGEPLLVADRLAQNPSTFASVALSASTSGLFAYRTFVESTRELVWMQRDGQQARTIGTISGFVSTAQPRLSPDASSVAVERRVAGNSDVWLIEAARGVPRRFTFDPAPEGNPIWSPDGSRIAFDSARKGGGLNDLFLKSLSGGAEEILLESAENKNLSDWSPDGRFVLYLNQSAKTGRDIWALPSEGERKPFVVVQTAFEEGQARFSPDGRWIAYQSNETGRTEVFVQPFPGPGRNWQISTDGGFVPQWRGDGREIFYIAPDNRLMAAPLTLDLRGASVDAGNPVALFPLRPGASFAAAPDGLRFLISAPTDEATASPITVVLNWKPKVQ